MKEASQSSIAPVSSQSPSTGNTAATAGAGGGMLSAATLDHQCCHQHKKQLVQQKLQQLHQQLQQAAGHSAIDSLQQVTSTEPHLCVGNGKNHTLVMLLGSTLSR